MEEEVVEASRAISNTKAQAYLSYEPVEESEPHMGKGIEVKNPIDPRPEGDRAKVEEDFGLKNHRQFCPRKPSYPVGKCVHMRLTLLMTMGNFIPHAAEQTGATWFLFGEIRIRFDTSFLLV